MDRIKLQCVGHMDPEALRLYFIIKVNTLWWNIYLFVLRIIQTIIGKKIEAYVFKWHKKDWKSNFNGNFPFYAKTTGANCKSLCMFLYYIIAICYVHHAYRSILKRSVNVTKLLLFAPFYLIAKTFDGNCSHIYTRSFAFIRLTYS